MSDHEATIELDLDGSEPLVYLTLPRQGFTLRQLRQFAGYLATVADENEPSPEAEQLAGILETAALISKSPQAVARAILGAGYKLTETTGETA